MVENVSKKEQVFKKIQEFYFKNQYKDLVTFWENNSRYYPIDDRNENDNNVLESLAISYQETGQLKKSLYYRDIQINQLKVMKIADHLKAKKYKYYYGGKIDIYINQGKKLLLYRTLWKYMNQFGKDDTFLKMSVSLEDYFYAKYLRFLKYLFYVLLSLVIIVISILQLGYKIPTRIYQTYNIASIIGFLWIFPHLLFPRKIRQFALSRLRYLLRFL